MYDTEICPAKYQPSHRRATLQIVSKCSLERWAEHRVTMDGKSLCSEANGVGAASPIAPSPSCSLHHHVQDVTLKGHSGLFSHEALLNSYFLSLVLISEKTNMDSQLKLLPYAHAVLGSAGTLGRAPNGLCLQAAAFSHITRQWMALLGMQLKITSAPIIGIIYFIIFVLFENLRQEDEEERL